MPDPGDGLPGPAGRRTPDAGVPRQLAGGWRFRLGVALFVLGLIAPVFLPLVAMLSVSTEIKATLSGAVLAGAEVLWVLAAAIMGKSGFLYLKGQASAWIKSHGPPKTVSRMRYRVGLVMFVLPLMLAWVAPYVAILIPGYESHPISLALAGDLLLLVSLFVLGGDFWDKLRALFVYDVRVHWRGRPSGDADGLT